MEESGRKRKRTATSAEIKAAREMVQKPDRLFRQMLAETAPPGRNVKKCTGHSFERDEYGEKILGPDNKWLRKPCERDAINGSTVCPTHGGATPAVKTAAERTLAEYKDRAAERLTELAEQGADLKVSLGASLAVLKQQKVIKEYKDEGGGGAPKVVIAVNFGGLQTGEKPKVIARVLPQLAPVDAEVHEIEEEEE